MKTWSRSSVLQLAWSIVLLLLIVGCGDDSTAPCTPAVPTGRIEGVVRVGDVLLDAYVRAIRIPGPGQSTATINAKPHPATGAYSIDVPAGRYVVGFSFRDAGDFDYGYSAEGLRFGDLPPDTLLIDDTDNPVRVDFRLATVTAHLDLSPGLNGEYAYIRLHRRNTPEPTGYRTYVNSGGAEIEDGMADIDILGVLPGEYKIEVILGRRYYLCDCSWDGEHFWIPGTRDSTQSPWVAVGADDVVEVHASIDPEPARIEGRVSGAWLTMGSGDEPDIALCALDSSLIMGDRAVGEDGRFAVDIYLPEPVKVAVDQRGVRQWIGGRSFADAQVFTLERGQTTTVPEFVQSGLRLHVTRPEIPLFDIKVGIYDAASRALLHEWAPSYFPPGDPLGICNLVPGSYLLRIEPYDNFLQRWLPQWYDRASSPDGARIVVIGADGDVVDLPVVIERGGGITGTILDREASEDGFLIYVTRADDRATTQMDMAYPPSRSFEVYGLPDGNWKVGAWRRGNGYPDEPPEGTIWYPGTTDWSEAGVITIQGASEVTGIEIQAAGR